MAEVAALILAAGRASRFREGSGLATKMVALWQGEPLVRHVARAALASRARPVLVVTGHARAEVEQALAGLPVQFVHNAGFASGLAGSLQSGLAALGPAAGGVLVLLGDMPQVTAATCDRLMAAFAAAPAQTVAVLPAFTGAIGNPVLLARGLFGEVADLSGDQGARRILPGGRAGVLLVPVDDPGILADVDTPQALAALPGLTGQTKTTPPA